MTVDQGLVSSCRSVGVRSDDIKKLATEKRNADVSKVTQSL